MLQGKQAIYSGQKRTPPGRGSFSKIASAGQAAVTFVACRPLGPCSTSKFTL